MHFSYSFFFASRIIGDLSEPGADDQFIRWGTGLVSSWSLPTSLLLVGPVAATLIRAKRRNSGVWRFGLLIRIAAGSIAGIMFRVATARVGGANIGGVFSLYVGLPLVEALLCFDVWLFAQANTA